MKGRSYFEWRADLSFPLTCGLRQGCVDSLDEARQDLGCNKACPSAPRRCIQTSAAEPVTMEIVTKHAGMLRSRCVAGARECEECESARGQRGMSSFTVLRTGCQRGGSITALSLRRSPRDYGQSSESSISAGAQQ